jgi:hypothetical protein
MPCWRCALLLQKDPIATPAPRSIACIYGKEKALWQKSGGGRNEVQS